MGQTWGRTGWWGLRRAGFPIRLWSRQGRASASLDQEPWETTVIQGTAADSLPLQTETAPW